MPNLYANNFESAPLGSSPFSGASSPGGGTAGSAVVTATSPVRGVRSLAQVSAVDGQVQYDATIADQADGELVFCQRVRRSGSTNAVAGAMLRVDATGANGYVALPQVGADALNLYLAPGYSVLSGGALSTYPGIARAVVDGDLLWTRMRCQGTMISAKAWLDGVAEPAAWLASATSGAYATGKFGLRNGVNLAGQAIVVDDVASGDLSLAAPVPYAPAAGVGTASVAFLWAPATGGTAGFSYQLRVSVHGAGSFADAAAPTGLLAATATGLAPATAYDFELVVTDAASGTSTSAIATVTTAGGAGTMSANLATVYPSATAVMEAILTGIGTAWAGSTAFSVAGGTGASIVSQANVSPTVQVVKYLAGTAPGVLTFSNNTDAATCTVTVAAGSVARPNASTVGLKGKTIVSAQEAASITTGPAGMLAFAGDSIRLRFNMGGVTVGPDVLYQVDRDPIRRAPVTAANPAIAINPAYTSTTPVRASQHLLRWWRAVYEGAGDPTYGTIEKWATRQSAARLAGVDLPGAGSLLPLPPANPNVLWAVGDSITESVRALYTGSGASDQSVEQPALAWPQLLADAIGCDLLQEGYGGTGVTTAGSGGVPAAPASIGFAYAGAAFTPAVAPCIGVLLHGTNDQAASSGAFRAAYTATVNAMRAVNSSMLIFCVNPHTLAGGTSRLADITAAVAGISGITVGDATTAGIASGDMVDGTHLNPGGHARLALFLESLIQTTLDSAGIKLQAAGVGGGGIGNLTGGGLIR